VPGQTEGRFYVRTETLKELADLRRRVEQCFQAGALATGCQLYITLESPPYSEFDSDSAFEAFYQFNAEKLGRNFAQAERSGTGSRTWPTCRLSSRPSIRPLVWTAARR
jgi:metal-dependent amidase/aminoacylase/carboxypeptidase family protein